MTLLKKLTLASLLGSILMIVVASPALAGGGSATLTVNPEGAGMGYVDSSPAGIDCGRNISGHEECSGVYAVNTSVTLTAHPNANNDFEGFTSGGCSGTGMTCTVTMNQARDVTATFTPAQRTLTLTTAGGGGGRVDSSLGGIDCGRSDPARTDCSENYDHGSILTLTAHPVANTDFAGFSGGGCSGTGTTCTLTMDQNRSVTATFTPTQRALTVSGAGDGSGYVDSAPAGIDCGRNIVGHTDCSQNFDHGRSVTLTAHPGADSEFTGFSGEGCSGTGMTCTVTANQVRSVTAIFGLKPGAPVTPVEPDEPDEPSNRFLWSRVRVGARGRLKMRFDLPGAGELDVTPSPRRFVSGPRHVVLAEAASRRVVLRITDRGHRRLRRTGETLSIVITARFTPTGGTERVRRRTVEIHEVQRDGRWIVERS